MTRWTRWSLLLILLTILLRVPAIIHPKYIDDDGGYAVVAHELLAGETLYQSAIDRKPPLLLWIYGAIFFVVGDYHWFLFHLVGVIWILLTLVGFYSIGKTLFNSEVGLSASLLYTLYTTSMYFRNLAFNGEVMMNLPIVWALLIAFRPQTSRSRPELLCSGFLLGCAFLIKQPAAVAALPIGLYVLLPSYRDQRGLNLRHVILQAMFLITGFALALGVVVLMLYHQGILRDAYYWTIGDHDVYHGPTSSVFWSKGIGMSLAHAVAWLPLVLLCWVSIREGRQPGAHYWHQREPELIMLLILLGVSFIGVSASGRFFPHYYLQLLPPLALLGAPALAAIWIHERAYRLWILRPRPLRFLLYGTAFAFLVTNTHALWQRRPMNEFCQYVRDHSTPADKVFFWGEKDYYYAEAQRRPASRYIHTAPLTGYIFGSPLINDPNYDTSYRIHPGAWDTLKHDFHQSPPLYFVDLDPGTVAQKYPPSRYPFFRYLLAEDYEVVLSRPDGVIYKRTAP